MTPRNTDIRDQKQDKANPLRMLARGLAAVSEVFVSITAGYLVGLFLDYWLVKTDPWMKVTFAVLGLITGFYRLYKIYSRE